MPPVQEERIYKLLSAGQWEALRENSLFEGSADDQRDGFIHLSLGSQVSGTLARHYAQVDGVVLIEVDSEPLGNALVYEPSRNGALFPHLFGVLPLSACTAVARRERFDGDWTPL